MMEDLFKIHEWSAKVERCDFSRVLRRKNERATERRGRQGETAGRMEVGGEGVGHVTHRMARPHQPLIRSKLKFYKVDVFFSLSIFWRSEGGYEKNGTALWLIDWFSFPSVRLNCEKENKRAMRCAHILHACRNPGGLKEQNCGGFLAWRLRPITEDRAKCAICCRNGTAWKDVPDN